jgi:hypothetical protein
VSSDEPQRTEPDASPRGRYYANWGLIFAALTIFMPLAIFGPIGLLLGYLAYRSGDRERGKIALIAVTGVIVVRALLIFALRPGGGPAV